MYTYGLCIRRSISPTRNIIVNETYGERRRSKSKTYGDRRAYFSFHAIRKIDAFSFRSGSGATKIKSGKVFKPPSLLYGKSTNGEIISARTRPDYPRFDGYLPLVLAGREEEIIFRVEYVSRASVSRSRIHRAHLPPPNVSCRSIKTIWTTPAGRRRMSSGGQEGLRGARRRLFRLSVYTTATVSRNIVFISRD